MGTERIGTETVRAEAESKVTEKGEEQKNAREDGQRRWTRGKARKEGGEGRRRKERRRRSSESGAVKTSLTVRMVQSRHR
jgi:hypothetical protein